MERTWSEQQNAIFGWFQNGRGTNAVVVARAGTGKTTTIIEGINRAPESAILLCAFNKRIAEELTARIRNRNARAQTLHAVGFAAVRRFWSSVGVERNSGDRANDLTAAVCGHTVPDAIAKLVSKLHTKAREIKPLARTFGDITDLLYAFECDPEESWIDAGYGADYVETKALEAMELAARTKPAKGIDFADMIFLPVRNGWLRGQFDLVVVDEAQDMNVAQLLIAQGVLRNGGRMAVVGDDRQAIYGFRGADSESLARLTRELRAVVFPLNITYRCGKAIVEAAATLVPDFTAAPMNSNGLIERLAHDKVVETAAAGDFILSRLNAPLVGYAMALLRAQKRTRIAGRDIGAGLKALVRKLSKNAHTVDELIQKIDIWAEREANRFANLGRETQVEQVRDKAETLITIAEGAESIREMESRIDALFTDDGLGQAGVITCSSIHRAKGLEADRVFVLDFTLYRRGRDIEEQNLEYVAVTRAKNTLVRVFEKPVVQ